MDCVGMCTLHRIIAVLLLAISVTSLRSILWIVTAPRSVSVLHPSVGERIIRGETLKSLPRCPDLIPSLDGTANITSYDNLTIREIETRNRNVRPGGTWRPLACEPRFRVAVLVPIRDRQAHLLAFLDHMHPFLQAQFLDYTIVVIEQDDAEQFNRGLLLNIGFNLTSQSGHFDCYYLHDVDLLPTRKNNVYDCPSMPRHVASRQSKHFYKPLVYYFGGVVALSGDHYRLVNGFSNVYFGWGAEDDDFYARFGQLNIPLSRYTGSEGIYKSLDHKPSDAGKDRYWWLLKAKHPMEKDGLSTMKYKLVASEARPLYTFYLVRLNKTEIRVQFGDN